MRKNRIIQAVANVRQKIDERLSAGIIDEKRLDALHRSLDMDILEYCRFQELKSAAAVSGKLTLDEAQTIYQYLGNVPETFNEQPVEVKSALTQVFAELIGQRIGVSA